MINFFNGVIGWFAKLPENIWNWLRQTIKNIINWGLEMQQKADQAMRDLVNNIINIIKELPSKVLEIGKNIVEGLWNGISGAAGWLWGKVTGFCNGVVDGIKSTFGIHSPSKVFKDEVGKFLALGIGEGFNDNLDKVYRQMKAAVDFETQRLSANLSTTATTNRVLNANITLRASDIYMDSTKVGRAVTPSITKTLRGAGAY